MADAQQNRLTHRLVFRCQQREEAAFRTLVELWERRLWYYLRRLLEREDAVWDTLQEVWITVVRKIGSLNDPSRFGTWVYRIAHNAAIDQIRTEKRDMEVLMEMQLRAGEVEETDLAMEQAELVHWVLSTLSLPHREVLTLHLMENFSTKEITEVVGVSEGTVKSRLHYAKACARNALRKVNP